MSEGLAQLFMGENDQITDWKPEGYYSKNAIIFANVIIIRDKSNKRERIIILRGAKNSEGSG